MREFGRVLLFLLGLATCELLGYLLLLPGLFLLFGAGVELWSGTAILVLYGSIVYAVMWMTDRPAPPDPAPAASAEAPRNHR